MIEAIKKYAGPYRAVAIKKTMGMEGPGWSATIAKDGRVIGEAADWGTGGPVHIHIRDQAVMKELDKHARDVYDGDCNFEITERFLDDLVNYEILIETWRKKAAKRILESDDSKVDDNGVSFQCFTWTLEPTPENFAKLKAKKPGIKFLNDEFKEWPKLSLRK